MHLDIIFTLKDFSILSYMCRLLLIKEIVSLMYLISVYDPFFDTHLKQCEYWYVFVLNRLSFLFSTAKGEELDEGIMDHYVISELFSTSLKSSLQLHWW